MTAYILRTKRDINNPNADRRYKSWDKQPVIPAGSRFIVNVNIAAGAAYNSLRPSNTKWSDYQFAASAIGRLIIDNGEEVEPATIPEMVAVYKCDFGADEILRILVKLGRIGPMDFKAVAEAPEDL